MPPTTVRSHEPPGTIGTDARRVDVPAIGVGCDARGLMILLAECACCCEVRTASPAGGAWRVDGSTPVRTSALGAEHDAPAAGVAGSVLPRSPFGTIDLRNVGL